MVQARIEHVVVLMMENRSFDHMLGLYPDKKIDGLYGGDGRTIDPKYSNSVAGKAAPYSARAGAAYVTSQEQVDQKGFGGPAHSFPAATKQLYGTDVPTTFPDPAPLSGFAQSYVDQLRIDVKIANPTDDQISVPMTAFEHGHLPVLWQLAQEFCVCDHWFSEVPGPTQPNRLFVHAGTAAGFTHNVWSRSFANRTIYEELEKAGHDWAVFYFDLRDSDSFPQISKRTERVLKFDSFLARAKAGTLPSYAFLCPRYNEPKQPGDSPPNSQHAPYDVRNGENLIADVYEALRNGPGWGGTLLIVTYDEHGGYYDHVSPPATNIANPDGLISPTEDDKARAEADPHGNGYLMKPNYRFDFQRLGVRVPALLVSPLVPRGSVAKQVLQHTSIFATLRDLFGVGTLTRRDAQAASFASQLSLASARADAPTHLNRPPSTSGPNPAALAAPVTHQQSEMWPLLAHLAGHQDTGKVTTPPPTREAASDYIAERLAAHEAFHRERRRKAEYRVGRDVAGKLVWALHDDRGRAIATSPGPYETLAELDADIGSLRDLAAFARQTDSA